MSFHPPRLLRSPHVQTVVARWAGGGARNDPVADEVVLPCRGGSRLKALVTAASTQSPLVIIIHGWLGDARSSYVCRIAQALHAHGFAVARLLLRDHGGTHTLNREMFNSARLGEVVDACNGLLARFPSVVAGIAGFSLGGNFALRVACHKQSDTRLAACLAISPVIDPAATVHAIDSGWVGYQKWFVLEWRRALVAKRAAFPEAYGDLDGALRLATVDGITDYVVARYLSYSDSRDYYARYDLRGDALAQLRMPARIVAALDDPVIPAGVYEDISGSSRLALQLSRYGGHCGFVQDWRLTPYLNAETVSYFRQRLGW